MNGILKLLENRFHMLITPLDMSSLETTSVFGPANLFNDVALLILETPVKLSAHINTICLPPQNYTFNRSTCIGTGWGADKFEQRGAYRVNLKKVQLPIVPAKECQDSLRTTKLGAHFKLDSSFLCAGGMKDVDTCTGLTSFVFIKINIQF